VATPPALLGDVKPDEGYVKMAPIWVSSGCTTTLASASFKSVISRTVMLLTVFAMMVLSSEAVR
jgi:hypothetical protein